MSETRQLARIIRPADDDAFIEPEIIAFLSTQGNVVLVRRQAWNERNPKLVSAVHRLTHDNPVYFGG